MKGRRFLLFDKLNVYCLCVVPFYRLSCMTFNQLIKNVLRIWICKINNTLLGFHNDIQNLFVIMLKDLYPEHVLNKSINSYLIYIGRFSNVAQNSVSKLVCKSIF